MNEIIRRKALIVQELVRKHYVPERLDKCKTAVYRNYVNKAIPMSERSFWRYLKMDLDEDEKEKAEDEKR